MKSSEIKIVDNLLDSQTISELIDSADKHFEQNLMFSDFIDVTNSIIDCHGLALSDTAVFPYSERCWNIFCLKVKQNVDNYCKNLGVDPIAVIPFSCWAERSLHSEQPANPDASFVRDALDVVKDTQVKKHFLRSVYNLIPYNKFYGTIIDFHDTMKIKKVESKENRLTIYDGGTYKSSHYYPNAPGKCNIVFDWYINIPYDVPDWILPVS
tara:strand:+ start:6675 stop:7307 length:633 start_codon:yes stop_codon:yes gene_type:complete